MVIMDSQNRKGALYQIVVFVLAKPALLILATFPCLFWETLYTRFSETRYARFQTA